MTCHKDIKRGCKLSTKTEKQPKIQQNDIILSSILEKMHTKLIKKATNICTYANFIVPLQKFSHPLRKKHYKSHSKI